MRYIRQTERLSDKYKNLSDADLSSVTKDFKERLIKGENPKRLIPDAFAAVRETASRTIGLRHYKEQLMGGIGLYFGNIIEMKTGEGKTLAATTAAYLKALQGKVHIVTVNDYLAQTNKEQMSKVFGFLGLTTGCIKEGMPGNERKKEYSCDIVYGTNKEFCFDYLRDQLVYDRRECVQQGHDFVIIDEIDSILIDEARTPLIISCNLTNDTEQLQNIDRFAKLLVECPETKESVLSRIRALKGNVQNEKHGDYIVNRGINAVSLTNEGVVKAEEYFGLEYFASSENADLINKILLALKANYLFEKGRDYIVVDGKIAIVDSYTGRVLQGRKYGDGLHQAIEAKENVEITPSTVNNASTTFKNYFSLYTTMSGMTGTAYTERKEFKKIYGLNIIKIPTHKKNRRIDHKDKAFILKKDKYKQMIADIKAIHDKGQPILIGSPTVTVSEEISALLDKEGLEHTVLNAKNHKKEAEIIAQAGRFGAITVSTNMAGRGTDIMLGGNAEALAKQEISREITDKTRLDTYLASFTPAETDPELHELYLSLLEKYKGQCDKNKKEVIEAGGLYIIGAERNNAKRIDNQLVGRSGRQGDVGESCYYLSAEDDIVNTFNAYMSSVLQKKKEGKITRRKLKALVYRSQKQCQDIFFEQRRYTNAIDDIDAIERDNIYGIRESLLNAESTEEIIEGIFEITAQNIAMEIFGVQKKIKVSQDIITAEVNKHLMDEYEYETNFTFLSEKKHISTKDIAEALFSHFKADYLEKSEPILSDFHTSKLEEERKSLLWAIDKEWTVYLTIISHYANTIGNFIMGTQKPIEVYKQEVVSEHKILYNNLTTSVFERLLAYKKGHKKIALRKINYEKLKKA